MENRLLIVVYKQSERKLTKCRSTYPVMRRKEELSLEVAVASSEMMATSSNKAHGLCQEVMSVHAKNAECSKF
jgi:hypothetical protein